MLVSFFEIPSSIPLTSSTVADGLLTQVVSSLEAFVISATSRSRVFWEALNFLFNIS